MVLDILKEMPIGKIFVIPVRLNDCQVPDSFSDILFDNLFEEGNFEKIERIIKYVLKETEQKFLNEGEEIYNSIILL